MTTLAQVMTKQPLWFSPKNKRFFNDIKYFLKLGKQSKKLFLCISTYAWTDMFGGKPRLHYRLNKIETDLSIGKLLDDEFADMNEVSQFLMEH